MKFPLVFIGIATICFVFCLPAYAGGNHYGHDGVAISPLSANLQVGQSQQFTATVSGTGDQTVNWLVNGIVGGSSAVGTITASGFYTAPAAAPSGPVSVTAQSVNPNAPFASATVIVTSQPGTSITVSISPTNASLQTGQTKQFSAIVSGTTNTSVNWLVNGVSGGNSTAGTISSAGLYTAPAAAPSGSVSVTAQSVYQPSTSAKASVSISQPPQVTVSVSPTNASLQTGQTQQFSATVSGTSSTGINWLVNGALGGSSAAGTISSAGLYTAPAAVPSGSVTVTAQSTYQSSTMANASVSIAAPPPVTVSVSPASASLETGQAQQFTATVSGTTNIGVNWLVNGVLGGNSSVGTISSAGLYTAPGSATQVTITGQSVYQPSSSATAAVTVALPVTHSVSLSWQSSASSPAGYNVYRGTQATGPFAKLNSSLDTATVYMDNTVVSGQTYYYVATAVDSSGVESGHSTVAQAVIP